MHPASDGEKRKVIGLLSYAPVPPARFQALVQRFAELGYRQRLDVQLELRSSARDKLATARYAEELLAMEPAVVWAMNTNAAVAVREAMGARRVPTVFWATDPVESGIVDDLATPGQFTGFAAPVDLQLLQLRFIRATWPGLRQVPLLYNRGYGPAPSALRGLQREAGLYGMRIDVREVAEVAEFEPLLAALAREEARVFLVGPHALFNTNGATIGALAREHRLAAVAVQESIVRGGGLVSFFPTSRHIQNGIFQIIDRILKGTPVEAIPIDRKIGFTCMIHRGTIERLGLQVPAYLLSEADELIG